ncbi:hypothetical protein [uncultured Acinetobacter sp.]|uniref:hypothetical protein n=1 Tax=uncultured Acinetobacter sp. TaxID=165433 RepID=UPI002625D4DE|nr:hypothetical protein [uncultured Acinetobacter sp.]
MKKILILAAILLFAWLAKLSYDLIQLNQAQAQLQQKLHQAEQQNANLNDRLVALKRDNVQQTPVTEPHNDVQEIHPVVLIQQHLDLIEFALKQQQYAYALEKLSHLDADLKQSSLAESLQAALAAAIIQDRQDIQNFVTAKQAQQQQFNQVLQQVDVMLNAEIGQQNLAVPHEKQAAFWQKWFKLEQVEQPSKVLMQRQFVLKEAQLHLLLARQLLLQGQYLAYQQEMNAVVTILTALPDQKARQLIMHIEQAKAIRHLAMPALTTRALLR